MNQIARWLSRVFHPFLVSVITLILVIYLDGTTLLEAVEWTSIGLGIVILPLTLYLAINVRRGRYSDWSISVREQRYGIYLLAGICFITLVFTYAWAGAPRVALACLYAALATILVSAIINRLATKISLHAIALAGCATALFWMSASLGIFLMLAALAVGWARIQLHHHTLAQVLLGWGIAAGCTVITFAMYL